jgi:hypothetical protein
LVALCQPDHPNYVCTGERAMRDLQLVDDVCALLVSGRGMKAIRAIITSITVMAVAHERLSERALAVQ